MTATEAEDLAKFLIRAPDAERTEATTSAEFHALRTIAVVHSLLGQYMYMSI